MRDDLADLIAKSAGLPLAERVEVYNRALRALHTLVRDACEAPVLGLQLVPIASVSANDYNPNRVASPEMDLLEQSIRCDGLTMPVVTVPDGDGWVVVDGFHRRTVMDERIGSAWLPVTVIDGPRADRMASTIRHNRARGKHQVDRMGDIVRALIGQGWDDEKIAEHLGMTPEELLRLKQVVGAAHMMASREYGGSWDGGAWDGGRKP